MPCKEFFVKINQNLDKFKKIGAKMISIAIDNPRKLRKFKEVNKFDLEILVDRRGAISKKYNVFTTGTKADHKSLKFRISIPSTFLIDETGIIRWRFIGTREIRPSIDSLISNFEKNFPNRTV
ncbi:hypothetical protein NEF87_000302 [Candidatus Lokiarchaeum ossiferum]|uniref:Alkyl hydroperoxide reductase subunit C/ Thiol specific antioxidant domain-containing protein n=1 Tax=Candidatus Lokiarchaeum ossiferum TaxID=2951803 RepID=A0ABY6HNN5_9ARCH|nr:hypothetical protein NEF87_000302 [Candidatus Lokiarchaeum sp. B-35]